MSQEEDNNQHKTYLLGYVKGLLRNKDDMLDLSKCYSCLVDDSELSKYTNYLFFLYKKETGKKLYGTTLTRFQWTEFMDYLCFKCSDEYVKEIACRAVLQLSENKRSEKTKKRKRVNEEEEEERKELKVVDI